MLPHLELKNSFSKMWCVFYLGVTKKSQDLAKKMPKYSCVNQKISHHLGLKKLTKNFYWNKKFSLVC